MKKAMKKAEKKMVKEEKPMKKKIHEVSEKRIKDYGKKKK